MPPRLGLGRCRIQVSGEAENSLPSVLPFPGTFTASCLSVPCLSVSRLSQSCLGLGAACQRPDSLRMADWFPSLCPSLSQHAEGVRVGDAPGHLSLEQLLSQQGAPGLLS